MVELDFEEIVDLYFMLQENRCVKQCVLVTKQKHNQIQR